MKNGEVMGSKIFNRFYQDTEQFMRRQRFRKMSSWKLIIIKIRIKLILILAGKKSLLVNCVFEENISLSGLVNCFILNCDSVKSRDNY
jgi:hypothetical protein